MYSIIRNKNMSFIEILSLSVIVFLKKLIPILAITVLINVPVQLLDFLLWTFVLDLNKHSTLSLMIGILESFFILLSTISIIIIVNAEINKNELKLLHIFKRASSFWKNAITTSILEGIIIIGFMILLIIPGIIWMNYYVFTTQVVTLNNLKGKEALDYSKFLVKGRWWKVFLTLLPFTIIYIAIFRYLDIPRAVFGNINELSLICIPFREILNAFIVAVTSILFINFSFIFGKERTNNFEQPTMVDYFVSKTNSIIDDSEVDYDYGCDSSKTMCPECGTYLIESDEFCSACGTEVTKR